MESFSRVYRLVESFVDFCSLFESLVSILDCILTVFCFVTLLCLLLFFPGRFVSF